MRTQLQSRNPSKSPTRQRSNPEQLVAALPNLSLREKVKGQQRAVLLASRFAETKRHCRWATAKLKVERSIGQDFDKMRLQRGGSNARVATLKEALEQLRISKKTSQTWCKVARIPQEWFDAYLQHCGTEAAALSTEAILFRWDSEQPGHLNIAGAREPGEGHPSDLITVTPDPDGTPWDAIDTAVHVSMDPRDVKRAICTWTDAWELASFDREFLRKMQDLRRAFQVNGMTDAVVELVNRAHAAWC